LWCVQIELVPDEPQPQSQPHAQGVPRTANGATNGVEEHSGHGEWTTGGVD
jgi:hypothetical protein